MLGRYIKDKNKKVYFDSVYNINRNGNRNKICINMFT